MPHMTGPLYIDGVPYLPNGRPITGKVYFVDYDDGNDGNDGSCEYPLKLLTTAFSKCSTGRGDVIYLKSGINSASDCTAYITSAFDWDLDNTHLVGLGARTGVSQRSRISEVSGTGIDTLFTVSGNNCEFHNVQWFHGTSVDEDQVAVEITGERNLFSNCHFAGIGHATPAARAGSRSCVLTGADENTFLDCHFGLTTIDRTAANVELEFATKCARNEFYRCKFLSRCTGSGTGHGFIKLAASSLQDYVLFKDCIGINAIWSSYGVAMAYAFLKAVADVNGLVVLDGCRWKATNLAAELTDVVAEPRYDGTDLTTDLGIYVTPTNT